MRVMVSALSAVLLAQAALFTAADMLDIQTFARGQPITLSPDGERVAYVLTDIGDEWNIQARRPVGYVYVQETDGVARPMSSGKSRSSFPVWSPDGSQLAFFLEDEDGGQLAVWEASTNEVRPLGKGFSGRAYLAPQWTREGSRIVYASALAEEPSSPANAFARPKSSAFTLPSGVILILAGFRSRWTMPFSCAASTASAT